MRARKVPPASGRDASPMWPSCWAAADVAASASVSSMHQNLDRTVRLGRAVGEEKDGHEQRAFCTHRRRGGQGQGTAAAAWNREGKRALQPCDRALEKCTYDPRESLA